ncbi:hypothetical protein NOF55_21860 [Rhizobiaceae bacterium BDR2-2]|uniref:Uncharacterized protein n=1 Tax=Ectorhizobium quercum TaxID=2965071 RepID=A0AAE3SWT4_9HYPH|nr:hypothetical protein [Ectorhizobium quercum]MCX8999755.1 hypothetical protein [Ectorhizobium quercum]
MKTLVIAAALASTFAASSAFALEPIPGSITYNGQPATKLTASPVGSPLTHSFTDQFGRDVEETYIVTESRDLQLVSRRFLGDN